MSDMATLTLDDLITRLSKIREGIPGVTPVVFSNEEAPQAITGVTGRVTVDGVNPPKIEVFLS